MWQGHFQRIMDCKANYSSRRSFVTQLNYDVRGLGMHMTTLRNIILLITVAFCGNVLAGSVDQIALQRTACYGPCPIYTVTIKSDGTVIFDGEDHVKHKGKATSNISAVDWEFLVTSLQRVSFFSLKDRYSTKDDGCTDVWTDNPALGITVTRGKELKRVWYYQGCRGPQELPAIAWLGDTIDLVAKTQQWVGQE